MFTLKKSFMISCIATSAKSKKPLSMVGAIALMLFVAGCVGTFLQSSTLTTNSSLLFGRGLNLKNEFHCSNPHPEHPGECQEEFECTCDDGDICTVDTCGTSELDCIFTPLECGENEACDAFTGLCEEIETIVPCVAVIDEWNNRNYTSEWMEFRETYPRRAFCLLVPGSVQSLPNGFFNDTLLNPDGIDRTLVHTVVRDGGGALSSDWFTLCELDKISANSLSFIGLFIDTSGSMTLNTVRTSYDIFLDKLEAAELNISQVFNGAERWIDPFLTALAPEE